MLSIYVHIPFCEKKCPYCDFYSIPMSGLAVPQKEYAVVLAAQLKRDAAEYGLADREVGSIFFGGGTPSLMAPEFFEEVLAAIAGSMKIVKDAEISSESNPASADAPWFRGLKKAGVNRVTVGVQSFSDENLKKLGRIHDSREAKRAVAEALDAGFRSVGMDLIYGISGESAKDVEADLKSAMSFQPQHISAYQLTIEDTTPMYDAVVHGRTLLPDDDEILSQMRTVLRILTLGGWRRYEISNFAKSGFECRHNMNYWRYGEYLGLGSGAVSFLKLKNEELFAKRFSRVRDMKAYLSGDILEKEVDELTIHDAMSEFCFMALRTEMGISKSAFEKEFGIGFEDAYAGIAAELVKEKVAEQDGDNLKLTERGLEISNQIFEMFIK